MKRFVLLFIVGGLLLTAGQIALNLGIHPERIVSLRLLIEGSFGLVIGSVFAVTGLLELAEGYGAADRRLRGLIDLKQPVEADSSNVGTAGALERNSRRFWRSYLKTGSTLGLFMLAAFALAIWLSDNSYVSVAVLLCAGSGLVGLCTTAVGVRNLQAMHRSRMSAE